MANMQPIRHQSVLPLLIASALIINPTVTASIAKPVLHSFKEPKLTYFKGEETAQIATYHDAKQFCANKGRILASQREWCLDWHDNPSEENIYGGMQPNEEWVPVRTDRGLNLDINEWLQVGHFSHEDNKAEMENVCQTYKKIHNISEPEDATLVIMADGGGTEGEFCEKPFGCEGNTCVFWCNHDEGYYPDPHDCSAYCYCSGQSGKPSFWQEVEGDGLVWDPYCGDSEPLDKHNKPLGGMTGGCPNHDWAVLDSHYCANPESQHERNLAMIEVQPRWGVTGSKEKMEANSLLCTLLPKAPKFPSTCASMWGDPHILTFDQLKYECQGTGEYVLAKSLDSTFQLQGRLEKFNDKIQATVATGAVLKTGEEGEPTVEVRFPKGECRMEYVIDGTKMDLDYGWVRNGTLAAGTEAVHYFVDHDDRYFYFPSSGISFHIRKKHSGDMGCYINIKICLPDIMKESHRIIGMFGTPNGDPSDDFMNHTGDPTPVKGSHFKPAYEYCTGNWCLREDYHSLFESPMSGAGQHCDEPYDNSLEMMVMTSSPELFAICEGDLACLIEGVAGDLSDSTDSVTEQRILARSEMSPEEKVDDTDPLEQNDIFELTEAKAATPPQEAYTKGDPHFKTFGGEYFDFHGACDLVLLHNPTFHHGTGMDIHVRTKIQTWWSYVEAAAVRIGPDFLEVIGGSENTEWIWVNDKPNKPMVDGQWHMSQISGYKVRYRQNGPSREATIYLGESEVIVIKTYKDFVKVDLDLKDPYLYAGTMGLLGRYPDGARLGRDRVTMVSNPNEFGQEWQVLPKEPKLFHTYEDAVTAPQRCTMPTASTTSLRRRRLRESSVSREDAAKACGHLEGPLDRSACVSDVLATEDLSMADEF